MRPNLKQSTRIINYNSNSNSDSDNDVEFVNIDLRCNKLSILLLTNFSIIYSKKKRIVEIDNKVDEAPKLKAIQNKNILVKRIAMNSF